MAQRSNHQELFQAMISRLEKRLNRLLSNEIQFPGVLLVKAKHHALQGDSKKANAILQQAPIKTWALKWQIKRDPLLSKLISSPST